MAAYWGLFRSHRLLSFALFHVVHRWNFYPQIVLAQQKWTAGAKAKEYGSLGWTFFFSFAWNFGIENKRGQKSEMRGSKLAKIAELVTHSREAEEEKRADIGQSIILGSNEFPDSIIKRISDDEKPEMTNCFFKIEEPSM